MHDLAGGLVLGYHGCDASVGEPLLKGEAVLPNNNNWDWLGPGIHSWEANPRRALDFAQELAARQ